jgi:Zn-dependent peptidase ImmA (M78 family)
MAARAQISPQILDWAIKRSDSSIAAIASKLNLKQEKVAEWIAGSASPTFRQAEVLAASLRIPFGYLFLSRPPARELVLPDFRRSPDGSDLSPSPDCIDAVNDIKSKQDWYRQNQADRGAERVATIGSSSATDRTDSVAASIRTSIGLTEELRGTSSGPEDLLRELVRRTEAFGVLVMRSGTVGGNTHRPLGMGEFRGFAISDDLAPTIFINTSDSKTGQLFTLAHELAHLWLGASGISPANADQTSSSGQEGRTEVFCNHVAADVLLPRAFFNQLWTASTEGAADRARRVARRLRVSYLAVLIRANDLQLIENSQARGLIDEEKERIAQLEQGPKSTGGDFYASFFARNSERFTLTLLEATKEGRVFYQEAASLLGVRVPTIDKLVEKVLER